MQKEIRRLAMQLPERVASTPERVLFVNPFALTFVLLSARKSEHLAMGGNALLAYLPTQAETT